MSTYGWIITRDFLDEFGETAEVGTIGPRDISEDDTLRLQRGEGRRFRLYDDDGELYYEGKYIGDLEDGDPLTDFGEPFAGCTRMDEFVNGRWEICIS